MVANVYRRLSPRDFHPDAIPRVNAPSAAVIDNTTAAINAMGATDVIQEYESGPYWISSTISPSGGSADTSLGKKEVYFNNTSIRVVAGANVTPFQEVMNQGTGTAGLAGLVEPSGNLPPGETTRVIFDVTNTEQSVYSGNLFIHGGTSATGLCAIAACNRHGQDGVGGLESIWDKVQIASCRWGLFGTPRYGQPRNFYSGAFVGNVFQKLRIDASVTFPLLIGANQADDCFIGQLQLNNKTGATSYLYTTALCCGTIYSNGASGSDYAFNLENSHLIFGTFYAEKLFNAPIRAGTLSWVEGTCKYGAGVGVTVFTKKAFIYNDGISGGGRITAHERTAAATDAASLVLLNSRSGAKRNYWVSAPFSESDVPPFKMEAGTGVPTDKLISYYRDGLITWTPAGTGAAPTLTRAVLF